MPIGLNEGNVDRSVCPGFWKSAYGSSLAKTSETILEIATLKGLTRKEKKKKKKKKKRNEELQENYLRTEYPIQQQTVVCVEGLKSGFMGVQYQDIVIIQL